MARLYIASKLGEGPYSSTNLNAQTPNYRKINSLWYDRFDCPPNSGFLNSRSVGSWLPVGADLAPLPASIHADPRRKEARTLAVLHASIGVELPH